MNSIYTINSNFTSAIAAAPAATVPQSGFKAWEVIKQIFQEKNLNWTILGHAFFAVRIPLVYLDYFINHLKNDSPAGVAGSVLNFFSDIGSAIQWFTHLKIFDAAKVSAALGKIRCIGSLLTKIPFGSVVNTLFGFANIFYSIDAVIKLSKGNLDKKGRISAWLDLVTTIMQVVIFILFLAGCSTLPGVAIFSVLAAGMAVVSWSYRIFGNVGKPGTAKK